MERIPINPGSVDWSGENPGMYLKETPDGPFVTLISFFRVVLSPHGRGHAAFLLLTRMGTAWPTATQPLHHGQRALARYLKNDFVPHFGAFRGANGCELPVREGVAIHCVRDACTTYTERFHGESADVSLTWSR
jgi:hypothetical protein